MALVPFFLPNVSVKVKTKDRRQHYWIVTKDESGKSYLVYGGLSEEESRQKGMEMLGGMDFELKRYPTSSLPAASSFYHGKRLEQTHSPKKAMQRLGHDKSLRRLKRRRTVGGGSSTDW